ncbi:MULTISPECIES: nitrite reductase large subunit NirB [Sorangium]|uniref:Nitrite reductase n=1 Tax=Sorangium cellulosum TaxID=56 RepID=A0A4P2R7B7_SORCE|nr:MULTISPECIES: nitrite reductase large subunit NirB [Sorangium]AUX37953.1 nitrite reductase [Sorangium cellulosum]WCQ97240.1 Nitrite reductase [NAD(P)H] [Sorangium sp. Soce836]
MSKKKDLLVIGNGMVGHKLIENMVLGGSLREWNITTFCEEPRLAYDRVNLSAFFSGKSADDLSMVKPGLYEEAGIQVHLGDKAVSIDRRKKAVTSAKGRTVYYDKLILATGSYPFVPPIKGKDAKGCFVYRTIEDLEAMAAHAKGAKVGTVIGGGLLGLEAANALKNMGLEVHVVEFAPRLMALQVDDAGGTILRRKIESLGVHVHTSTSTTEIVAEHGRVARMLFADQTDLATDMIVFSAGIRPRDELARACDLAIGSRGGVVINERCQTSDPDIYAIGECASYQGQLYGLVAPGYHMAKVAADALTGGKETFGGFDMSTKLKLMGVDVASFGDAFAAQPGARVVSFMNATSNVYKKLVVSADGKHLLGGILVGDASNYGQLLQLVQNKIVLPPNPEDLIVTAREGAKPAGFGVEALPDTATICSCLNVTKKAICSAICDDKQVTLAAIKGHTKAGTGCGSCTTLITDILKKELKKAGVAVTNYICEHFNYSRQELYHLVRVHAIKTFDDLIARHGKGNGCEICKPAVASILASTWNEHILSKKHLPLQDTNDRFLANVQRDGTYSVVPRVAAGEITPDQLIALGQVAKKYNLYSKITGGQRVDLFGARLEQLPDIWGELIDAGFESGHAYGKALRTVKSCVGSTWCRYGVQDSVGFAVAVENRYKGLRSPHKLKSAVSGCARECAEAQSKDFGIIATEKGYNLYLCGNGGMKPQHAQLFAADLDEATLIKYLDRFLMFYIRTADRLQRTATWFNNLEGGMDYLRQVIIEDSLGICEELEKEMAHLIATYECEWKAAVSDPEKLKQFRPFVNAGEPDRSIVFVSERSQHRPAAWKEKSTLVEEMI